MYSQHNGNGTGEQLGENPAVLYLPDGTPAPPQPLPHNGSGCSVVLPKRETDFRRFPDGTVLDLVRDANDETRLRFIRWRDNTAVIVPNFEWDGQLFVPPTLRGDYVSALQLPTRALPCGPPDELLSMISGVLNPYVDLPQDNADLVSAYALYSCVADLLPIAVYLWICGPLGSGKTALLKILSCLCRRAVLSVDPTTSFIYSIVHKLRPTLLVDEFEESSKSRDVRRLLRAGSTQSLRVGRQNGCFETFGPKIIAGRQLPSDAALTSRAVLVSMLPTTRELRTLDSQAMEQIVAAVQPLLLMFRLRNLTRIQAAKVSVPGSFAGRMKDIAAALATPFLGDTKLESRLWAALELQNRDAILDLYSEPEYVVMLALYQECHRANGGRLFVGDIASAANAILGENGEALTFTPERVGRILRESLGLRSRRIGRGYCLDFTVAFKRKLHAMARNFGIKRSDIISAVAAENGYGGPPCKLCEEVGLTTDRDNKQLKFVNLPATQRQSMLYEPYDANES